MITCIAHTQKVEFEIKAIRETRGYLGDKNAITEIRLLRRKTPLLIRETKNLHSGLFDSTMAFLSLSGLFVSL